jgi:hypothetical protein
MSFFLNTLFIATVKYRNKHTITESCCVFIFDRMYLTLLITVTSFWKIQKTTLTLRTVNSEMFWYSRNSQAYLLKVSKQPDPLLVITCLATKVIIITYCLVIICGFVLQ